MTEIVIWLLSQLVAYLFIKMWVKNKAIKLAISIWVCAILWVWAYVMETYYGNTLEDIKIFLAWSFWWMQIFFNLGKQTWIFTFDDK